MSSMLELIDTLRLLLKDASSILATPDDAAYFRSSAVRANKEIQPVPIASPEPQIPKPIPTAEPAVKKPEPPRKEALPEPKPEPEPEKPRHLAASLSSVRTLLVKIAPELAILDEIPSDSIARKIANRWKTKNQSAPISVLSGGELPQHKAFLEEIAAALDVYFGPARIVQAEPIEKEKQWESFLSVEGLKLILICDSTLWQLHQLRQFYKETPTQGTRMLGKAPLFLLPDLSLYLKDPILKRSLWKALCQRCS